LRWRVADVDAWVAERTDSGGHCSGCSEDTR
jgi:hypothetical protein